MTVWISLALCALLGSTVAQDEGARIAIDPQPETPAAQGVVADAGAPRTLGLYDVSDLASALDPDQLLLAESPAAKDYRERAESKRLALLEQSIRNYVRPKFASGLDQLQVHGRTTFLVTATAEQHVWIRRFLELQRDQAAPFLMLSSWQVRGEAEQFERMGFSGPTRVIEDAAESQRAIRSLQDSRGGLELVNSPRLLIQPGSTAEISLLNQVSYVKRYDVVYVHPGPTAIADPVIGVVSEGTRSELAGIQVEPGLYALDVEIERTEIERPIPTKVVQVSIDSSAPMTISQPSVLSSKLSSTVLLRDGASVWFRVPDGERELLILVHLELVDAPSDSKSELEPPDRLVEPGHELEVEEQPQRRGERAREVPR